MSHNTHAHLRALLIANNLYLCGIAIRKWVNEKTLKKNELLLWVWQKRELQIAKTSQDTKQPRGTITTILRTFQLRRNVQIAKRLRKTFKDDTASPQTTKETDESGQKSSSIRFM